jgi:hypothetical protein
VLTSRCCALLCAAVRCCAAGCVVRRQMSDFNPSGARPPQFDPTQFGGALRATLTPVLTAPQHEGGCGLVRELCPLIVGFADVFPTWSMEGPESLSYPAADEGARAVADNLQTDFIVLTCAQHVTGRAIWSLRIVQKNGNHCNRLRCTLSSDPARALTRCAVPCGVCRVPCAHVCGLLVQTSSGSA